MIEREDDFSTET